MFKRIWKGMQKLANPVYETLADYKEQIFLLEVLCEALLIALGILLVVLLAVVL